MLDAGVFGQARFQLPGKFEELVAEGRFREAEELLRGWQPGAAGMSQGRRGWMRLVEAAQLWVDDLIRGNEVWGKYGLQVRDRQGTVRGSLLSVERTGPRVAAPDGEVQGLTWSEVDMGQWIDWHGRLVQLKSATGLRRWRILERQAAMERLVGDPVIAEQRVRAWLEESAWFAAVWPILEND
jgi:hypothetical protein